MDDAGERICQPRHVFQLRTRLLGVMSATPCLCLLCGRLPEVIRGLRGDVLMAAAAAASHLNIESR